MESKKHDPFLDLSLDIPEKFYKESASGNTDDGSGKQPSCHIADCLSSFTEVTRTCILKISIIQKIKNIFESSHLPLPLRLKS